MNYLNLEMLFLDREPFAAADSLDVGIWVRLLKYCAKVENGGRITGARLWKSCAWIRVTGTTDLEVQRESKGLWYFDHDDLIVLGYPIEQELKVKANRLNGKLGGRPGDKPKPHGKPPGKPHGKRKEKKRKETKTIGDFAVHPDDLDEYGPAPESTNPDPHPRWNDFLDERETFERFDAYLERTDNTPPPARN